jgi:hypothetical protein
MQLHSNDNTGGRRHCLDVAASNGLLYQSMKMRVTDRYMWNISVMMTGRGKQKYMG